MDDPAAYLAFAASLRAREDLPKELLSSLQRDLATELLRRASEKGTELQVEKEPWPAEVKKELLEAGKRGDVNKLRARRHKKSSSSFKRT